MFSNYVYIVGIGGVGQGFTPTLMKTARW